MLERRHVRVATDHNVRQEGRQARPCAHEKKEWIVCCKIRFGDVALERAKRNILHSVLYAQFFYSCCVIAYSCTPTSGDGPRGPRRAPTYIRAMAEAGTPKLMWANTEAAAKLPQSDSIETKWGLQLEPLALLLPYGHICDG